MTPTDYQLEVKIVNQQFNRNDCCFGQKVVYTACREEISLKRSIIANHITTVTDKQGKMKLAKKDSREKDVVEALVAYDMQEHPAFLKAGVPLAKLDYFQDLQENAYCL